MPPAPPKPYLFTQEQQARLDAHFGERAVWLPLPLDELVAALVEAQAREMGETEGEKARFTKDNEWPKIRVIPSVVHPDTETHDRGGRSMSASPASTRTTRKPDLSALSAQLITEVKKAFPGVELTQKASYIRAHLGRTTLGYLYPSPNGGKSAVETIRPDGSGKYAFQTVTNAAEA